MRLQIITPLSVAVEAQNIRALRAEDSSGHFGILPGHAEFLSSLVISVVGWTGADGTPGYCAVRGGMISVTGGQEITITTREAVPGDDLATLEAYVLARFRAALEVEKTERVASTQLQLNAIRMIMRHLRPDTRAAGEFS
jgi:F-type H+-transporting ATPase subunit epsilon